MVIFEIWCVYTYSTCPLRLATARLLDSPCGQYWTLELMIRWWHCFNHFISQLTWLQVFFLLMKTLRNYSLCKFQVHNTTWFTVVTVLQKTIPRTYPFSNWKFIPFDQHLHRLTPSFLATISCDGCDNHYYTDGKTDKKGRLKILPEFTAGLWRS